MSPSLNPSRQSFRGGRKAEQFRNFDSQSFADLLKILKTWSFQAPFHVAQKVHGDTQLFRHLLLSPVLLETKAP